MADLPEIDEFTAGVHQIATDEDVIGGVDGVSNRAAKALANRTKHLKEHSLMDDTNPIGNYTIGHLFYALGARLLGKLGIGAANRVLTSTGSAPQWSDSLTLGGAASFGGGSLSAGTDGWARLNGAGYMSSQRNSNLLDDTVWTIPAPGNGAMAFIYARVTSNGNFAAAIVAFIPGVNAGIMGAWQGWSANGANLTGTTGADGSINVGYGQNNVLQIENRWGVTIDITVTYLSRGQ